MKPLVEMSQGDNCARIAPFGCGLLTIGYVRVGGSPSEKKADDDLLDQLLEKLELNLEFCQRSQPQEAMIEVEECVALLKKKLEKTSQI